MLELPLLLVLIFFFMLPYRPQDPPHSDAVPAQKPVVEDEVDKDSGLESIQHPLSEPNHIPSSVFADRDTAHGM